MRSRIERVAMPGRILILGFCCLLIVSCNQPDDGLSPVEPPPAVSLPDMFGSFLLNAAGDTVGTEVLAGKDVIAIYFEGNWCPACAAFTPLLMDMYAELSLAGKSFEVVLVSYDVNTAELLDHMNDAGMLWLAVPPDGGKVGGLSQRYAVQFIPKVVVIDSDGNTVTLAGRDDIIDKGTQAYDDWLASIGGT